MMRRWKTVLFIFAGFAMVGAAGYFGYGGFAPGPARAAQAETPPATVAVEKGDVRQTVTAPGQLNATRQMDLTTGVAGQIAAVHVQPGDAVKKGQALAELANPSQYEAAAAAARLEMLSAKQALEELRANAPKETADAQKALLEAKEVYTKAQNKVEALKYPRASTERLDGALAEYQNALQEVALAQDRYDNLVNLGPDDPRKVEALLKLTNTQKEKDRLLAVYNWLSAKPTQKDIDDAQAELAQAKASYDNAQRKWERVKDGPDAMALDLAEAKVADAERKYTGAQDDLANLVLKAPYDGVIIDVKASAGEEVTAGAVLMTLSDPKALEARVTVVEEDFALVQPGLSALLYLDAQPDAAVTGRVARVVPNRTADSQPLYPVYIEIDQTPGRLAAGMTVDASIVVAEKKGVLVLPKALVRARTDGSATVQVWANGHKESREIQIGLIGDQNVEVISGLQEGEQVVGQ